MKKVITYGTFDLLHYGHLRLLERAKELGDYLIVGVTSDDFDKQRGKINVKQPLMERLQNVKETGLADEIIIEEYEGQKIDDIIKYGVDVFVLGSDWVGKFDYLKEYCEVIYLPRTEGVSSTELRNNDRKLKLGLVGEDIYLKKIYNESFYVNGIKVTAICSNEFDESDDTFKDIEIKTNDFDKLLDNVDALYLISNPKNHYDQIKKALLKHKSVLCESPITLDEKECKELFLLANKNKCVLMESIKTAYSTAYLRLLLLLKSGVIGNIVSVESTCTSLKDYMYFQKKDLNVEFNSICAWGPTAMLPIFQILGTNYKSLSIKSLFIDKEKKFDAFSKIDFLFDNAVGSVKVAKGIKSEGELIVSGTKGYLIVPSPWWITDYFEVRYENQNNNKRYFYQLEGEGFRHELVEFVKRVKQQYKNTNISEEVSLNIAKVMHEFYSDNVSEIQNSYKN